MINKNDFMKELSRLTNVFSNLTEIAMEEYYNYFKLFELSEIREAIDFLISDHPGDFTPKPNEILGAINEIRKQSSSLLPGEEAPSPECHECNSTGFKTWVDKQGRLKATPCLKCAKGQGIVNAPKIKKRLGYPSGWREAYQAHKKGKPITQTKPKPEHFPD